jgi:toxin FitB
VIAVDTTVISELMRRDPHPAVLAWVAAQPRALLYTTFVNRAEILYGIGAMPEGDEGRHPRRGLTTRPTG